MLQGVKHMWVGNLQTTSRLTGRVRSPGPGSPVSDGEWQKRPGNDNKSAQTPAFSVPVQSRFDDSCGANDLQQVRLYFPPNA